MASTLAIAAPATAQWTLSYGTQYGNQYGGQYGSQYGYGHNNHAHVRGLMVRVNRLERQIQQLDRRNILSSREANRLSRQANVIERRLRQASYNGLNGYEAREIQVRIVRLEQNIRHQANDGNRYGNRGYNNGSYAYSDRDRDGRNDRYEDDRGYDHD